MKSFRLFIFCLLLSATASSQTWQDTLQRIDKTMGQYLPDIPGVQLSVTRNNQLIFSKAWGMMINASALAGYTSKGRFR